MNYVAIDTPPQEAGALVYWSLSGFTDLAKLTGELALEGLPPELAPKAPSLEATVKRAARSCLESHGNTRMLLRPLSTRGAWDVVQETVHRDEDGKETMQHTPCIRVAVVRADGAATVTITPQAEEFGLLAQRIDQRVAAFADVLSTSDISDWLLTLLSRYVHAVSLRDRGGFYFVPRDETERWGAIVACVRAASGNHKLFSIPALQSEDAVEAILSAVRKEAEDAMDALQAYLSGDIISTRGLNSHERTLKEKRTKAQKYAVLLGVAIEDLNDKAVVLLGAINAARLSKGNS